MANIRKILSTHSPWPDDTSSYVGHFGEFVLDQDSGEILFMDGVTVGGTPVGTGGGGTSLVGFTSNINISPPNDSINYASLSAAMGTQPDISIALVPMGVGAFTLGIPDGTSFGGNVRGNWAVDLQISSSGKSSPTQIASGQFSFTCNGGNTASGYGSFASGIDTTATDFGSHSEGSFTHATANSAHAEGENTTASSGGSHAEGVNSNASNFASHAEGYGTIASGDLGSHAEGYQTTASGNNSHAEGANTTASAQSTHAEGGQTTASSSYAHSEGLFTVADGYASHASGQDSTTRGINYYQAYSTGLFSSIGDQQAGRLGLKAITTDSTPTVMTTDATGATGSNQVGLTANCAYAVTGTIVAFDGLDSASFSFTALAMSLSGTPSIVGSDVTPLYNTGGAVSWAITLSADESHNALSVIATGAGGTTINWTAEVRTQELTM